MAAMATTTATATAAAPAALAPDQPVYLFDISEVDTKTKSVISALQTTRNKKFMNEKGETVLQSMPVIIVQNYFTEETIKTPTLNTAKEAIGKIGNPKNIVAVSAAFLLKLMLEMTASTPSATHPAIEHQLFANELTTQALTTPLKIQMAFIAYIHGIHATAVADSRMTAQFTDSIPTRYRAVLKYLDDTTDPKKRLSNQQLWKGIITNIGKGTDIKIKDVNMTELINILKEPRKIVEMFKSVPDTAENDTGSVANANTGSVGSDNTEKGFASLETPKLRQTLNGVAEQLKKKYHETTP